MKKTNILMKIKNTLVLLLVPIFTLLVSNVSYAQTKEYQVVIDVTNPIPRLIIVNPAKFQGGEKVLLVYEITFAGEEKKEQTLQIIIPSGLKGEKELSISLGSDKIKVLSASAKLIE
jgi:hypothetical protein